VLPSWPGFRGYRPSGPPNDTMDEFAEITQHLLRSSPDALIVIDDRGTIRFANDTVTELFGHAPEQLLGQSVEMLVPERFRSRHGHHVSGFVREPRSREMGARIADLYARRADGSEFAAGIRLAPFRIKDKVFVAAAIRDISERQRINEELVHAREEAVRANRAKSRFLATASHDLRQPLQTIKLLNAAMTRLAGDSEIAELLKHQQHAIESTTRLLNALLDISRLESGSIEPQVARVSLPEMLDGLKSEFESIARTRSLDLIIRPVRVTLMTDRVLFTQLLQNLVGNALKYTDHGSVTIDCTMEAGALVVAIRDTGIGIPPDKLERIFDEYYQVDTHGTKRLGVGLGLAIVKEVARLLNFRVKIASTVGRSTEVKVTVPAELVAEAAPEATQARAQIADRAALPKTRILLVEDNDGVRMATELFLKLEGFEVRSAGSFADAEHMLDSLAAHDIIIADYHLDSAHTGLDVLNLARNRHGSDVPGVILSGDLPSLVRTLSSPIPATKFLSKPVDTDALLQAIKELSALPRGELGSSAKAFAR
jgi:PAS domain S-box-containing protein